MLQKTCTPVWANESLSTIFCWVCVCFAAALLHWAASCLSDYPASSRCQICHLQMSGRACGAEEWRGGGKRGLVKKKERKQNNWFCRHLERVQTGQWELQSVNGAQGNPARSHLIEKVAFWVIGFSRQRQEKESESERRREMPLIEVFAGMFHRNVLSPIICYLYYY